MEQEQKKAALAERKEQAETESKECIQQHTDGKLETWVQTAICQNDVWQRYYSDTHYKWMDLIASLNSTRSKLAADVDEGKITRDDMKAKMADSPLLIEVTDH